MKLRPAPLKPALLQPAPSKSDATRLAVLSHVLDEPGWERLYGEEPCASDISVVRDGLKALRQVGRGWVDIDCADGAAPFRFLLAQAAVTQGAQVRLWGTPRLGQRPRTGLIDSLTTALGAGGLRIAAGKPWPVEVTAPAKLPTVERFEVSGKETSQYVSALLLAACAQVKRHGQPCEVAWNSGLTSEGYVTLTVDWLKQVGFSVQAAAQSLRLEAWSPTRQTPVVPVDASGLGYLLLLAWRSGSAVRAYPLSRSHPDLAMENVLLEVGLQVERPAEGQLRVLGKAQRGLRADAAKAPDLMPTLAALACVLPEPSLLDNISILRRKESDRVEGIVAMVSAVGGCVEMQAEQLKILPPKKCQPFEVDSRGDHRLAMSAACLSVLAAVPADISQPACVKKSFPGFWQQLAAIGWGVGTDD